MDLGQGLMAGAPVNQPVQGNVNALDLNVAPQGEQNNVGPAQISNMDQPLDVQPLDDVVIQQEEAIEQRGQFKQEDLEASDHSGYTDQSINQQEVPDLNEVADEKGPVDQMIVLGLPTVHSPVNFLPEDVMEEELMADNDALNQIDGENTDINLQVGAVRIWPDTVADPIFESYVHHDVVKPWIPK